MKYKEAVELVKQFKTDEELMKLVNEVDYEVVLRLELNKLIKATYVRIEKDVYHRFKRFETGEKNFRYITKSKNFSAEPGQKYYRIDYKLI